jgi:hypothetical protein
MSEVREDSDGTSISNEPYHQTMAVQRLGYGHDRKINPPSSKGHRFILAITDYFTKWVEAVPMKSVASKNVINFVKEHVIYRFGIP